MKRWTFRIAVFLLLGAVAVAWVSGVPANAIWAPSNNGSAGQDEAQPRSEIRSPFGSEGASAALLRQEIALRDAPPRYYELGRGYVKVHLPFPVCDAEVERWGRMLSLSEAQTAVVAGFMKWYREEYEKLGEAEIRPLWEQSSDLADCPKSYPEAECVRRAEALAQAQRKVTAAIAALDDALFARINEVLAPVQLDSLRRVETSRKAERARYMRHFHNSAAIDLSTTLDYVSTHDALEIADTQSFSDALWEYEQMLARLVVEYQRKYSDAEPTGRRIAAAADPTSAMSRYQSRWKAVRNAEKRLVELNRTYLDVLSAQLEQKSAALLTRWFQEASYPEIYIGRRDATVLTELALNLTADDARKRQQVAAMSSEFEMQREQIEKTMTTLCDDFAYASIGVHPQFVRPKFEADLAAQRVARAQLEDQFAMSLQALFQSRPAEFDAEILRFLGRQPAAIEPESL